MTPEYMRSAMVRVIAANSVRPDWTAVDISQHTGVPLWLVKDLLKGGNRVAPQPTE